MRNTQLLTRSVAGNDVWFCSCTAADDAQYDCTARYKIRHMVYNLYMYKSEGRKCAKYMHFLRMLGEPFRRPTYMPWMYHDFTSWGLL